jgi:hypothetical protein
VTDSELLAAFESSALPNAAFRHADHLRVAWLCLRGEGPEAGGERFVGGLRRFAAAHGVPQLYHETLTRFWLRLVAHVMEAAGAPDRFDAVVARYPRLLDKTLPRHHWQPATLEAGRGAWVEPDLAPVP